MNRSKIGHIPLWPKYLHLSSVSRQNSPVDLLRLAVAGKFGLICDAGTQIIHLFPKLVGRILD